MPCSRNSKVERSIAHRRAEQSTPKRLRRLAASGAPRQETTVTMLLAAGDEIEAVQTRVSGGMAETAITGTTDERGAIIIAVTTTHHLHAGWI